MCNRSVDTNLSRIRFVPEYYKTQEKCDKAADTCTFVFDSVPDQYKSQKMCDKVVSKSVLY